MTFLASRGLRLPTTAQAEVLVSPGGFREHAGHSNVILMLNP